MSEKKKKKITKKGWRNCSRGKSTYLASIRKALSSNPSATKKKKKKERKENLY
jgi:hypothetical protein